MAITLGNFIKELAQITGNDKLDSLTALLADANKANIELPDDVVSGIKAKILTFDSAVANPAVAEVIWKSSLDKIDRELDEFMGNEKLDANIIADIKSETKTGKRAIKLAQKLRELEQAKISATGGDKKVLADKISALEGDLANVNAELVKERETATAKLSEKESEMLGKLRDYQVERHFSAYQYANDKIPLSVHVMTAKSLFEQKAKELGLKTVFDKETGQVKLLTSADSIYYKDNKPVNYQEFTDGLLAENHLLKVTEIGSGENQNNRTPLTIITGNGQGKQRDTSKMSEALNKSLAEVSQAPQN